MVHKTILLLEIMEDVNNNKKNQDMNNSLKEMVDFDIVINSNKFLQN